MPWSENLVSYLQAGALDPAGIVVGSGPDLPPPLNTYLDEGMVIVGPNGVMFYIGLRGGGAYTEQGMVTDTGVITIHTQYEQLTSTTTHWNILATLVDCTVSQFNFLGSNPATANMIMQDITVTSSGFFGTIFDMIGTGGFAVNRVTEDGTNNTTKYKGWDFQLDSTSTFHAPKVTDKPASFVPTITGGGAFAIGNGVRLAEQHIVGARNYVTFQYTFGSTSNEGTGGWTFGGFTASLTPDPAGISAFRPIGRWWYVKPASSQRATGDVLMAPGGTTVIFQAGGGLPTLAALTTVGQTVPEAWSNGSIISAEFHYPVAV